MPSLLSRPGHDPVARRRHRRLAARARPFLLPVAVLLATLLLGGRLLPADAPAAEPAAAPARAPAGHVLVVVTPSDPAVLAIAGPGAVVDVYGAQDPVLGMDVTGAGPPRAALLVRAAPVVGPGAGVTGVGPGPPGAALGSSLPGATGGGAVVLAVTDDEARTLAAQQGRGLSLAVRTTTEARPAPATAPPGGGDG